VLHDGADFAPQLACPLVLDQDIVLKKLIFIIGGNRHQPKPRMSLCWATRADHRGNPLALPDPSLRSGWQ